MLQLAVRIVHADQIDLLRDWMHQLQTTRRSEAEATLIDETVDHEQALLVEVAGRHLLIYAIEVRDPEQARRSADSGHHPIDAEHHEVLARALEQALPHEVLLDITPSNPDPGGTAGLTRDR